MADAAVVSEGETSDVSADESEYIPNQSSDDSDMCIQVKRRDENKGMKKRPFPELRKQQLKKTRRNSGKSYTNTAGNKVSLFLVRFYVKETLMYSICLQSSLHHNICTE